MSKIDTSKWGQFLMEDLFVIRGSTTTPKNNLNLDDEYEYPYVTTAGTNNGIFGYSDQYTEDGGVLTVDSAVLGTCFYQEKAFTASDHVEKLIPKFEIDEQIALFLCCVINKTGTLYNYAYNQKRSQTALKKEVLYLPVDKDGNPDWGYMRNVVSNAQSKASASLDYFEDMATS